jgi:hypothetical protein
VLLERFDSTQSLNRSKLPAARCNELEHILRNDHQRILPLPLYNMLTLVTEGDDHLFPRRDSGSKHQP